MAHMKAGPAVGQRRIVTILVLSLATTFWNCADSLSNVYTTAQDYTQEHNAGSIAGLFCALIDNPNPYGCENYAWVAYSISLGMDMSLCGKCIQITNTADGGGSIKACILDQKEAEGLDLDVPAFNEIDNPEGEGYFNGHMFTDVDFVDC